MACEPQAPQIEIEGAYATLSDMFLGAGSVFMDIHNTGGRDALLSTTADVSGSVSELHDVDGSRMVKIDRLAVPARSVVELKPGSRHIMVFNMPRTVREGSEIILTLRFERSGDKKVQVRFEKEGMRGGP